MQQSVEPDSGRAIPAASSVTRCPDELSQPWMNTDPLLLIIGEVPSFALINQPLASSGIDITDFCLIETISLSIFFANIQRKPSFFYFYHVLAMSQNPGTLFVPSK